MDGAPNMIGAAALDTVRKKHAQAAPQRRPADPRVPDRGRGRARHGGGQAYALANKGPDTRALQAYRGHRNIQHTVRYTELSPTRFKDFWRR